MVTREDKDFEKFSLSRHGMIALPLTVTDKNGSITYTCYKKIMKAISAFDFEGYDPFSAGSETKFRGITDPFMKKYKYTFEKSEALLEYMAVSPLPRGKVNTVILKTCDEIAKYPADTTLWNLDVDSNDDADVICAVIENGRITAYACVNDLADDDGYEITVECAPSSRRKGYAASCSADLTNYLLESCKASAVYYKCREGNEGSKRTAERAGFTYIGRSKSFVYAR